MSMPDANVVAQGVSGTLSAGQTFTYMTRATGGNYIIRVNGSYYGPNATDYTTATQFSLPQSPPLAVNVEATRLSLCPGLSPALARGFPSNRTQLTTHPPVVISFLFHL